MANAGNVRVGAIRWDAWYGDSAKTSEWYAKHNLDAPQYQYRAPFFSQKLSSALMSIKGDQAAMDAELVYASNAGLKFWAYVWYASNRPFRNAWNYHQASANKAMVNCCIIASYGPFAAGTVPTQAELVAAFQQSNYEKVGAKPLLLLYNDGNATAAQVGTALSSLNTACANAGIPTPAVYVMNGTPATAGTEATTIGAGGISCYAHAPPTPGTFASMDTNVQAFWSTMTAVGMPTIPLGMTGWDRRPRIEGALPFEPQLPFQGMNQFIIPGTAAQIASHVSALVAFVTNNASACPANKALLYSWNEHDEGGGTLCPTWTPSGPDSSVLVALASVLQ